MKLYPREKIYLVNLYENENNINCPAADGQAIVIAYDEDDAVDRLCEHYCGIFFEIVGEINNATANEYIHSGFEVVA